MDFVDRAYCRRSRWVGETGTIAWEWDGPVRVLPSGETLWADGGFELESTYAAALRDFVEAVETGSAPRSTGWDALRTLELCDALRSGL
jgi:predicted dehydrogenase